MEYELYHYGIRGMKWGVRRKRDYFGTGGVKGGPYRQEGTPSGAKGGPRKQEPVGVVKGGPNTVNKSYTAPRKVTKKASAAKKASTGKKRAQKIVRSGVKATAKTVGYGAQVAMRMMQNAAVYNATGAMFDAFYRD